MNRINIAKEIFEEIRDRPYRATIYPAKAWNCYFKGVELIDRLTTLGFSMRAKIGEMDWRDTPTPPDIVKLNPAESLDTHFYPEIFIDEEWRVLDPSWNKGFAQKYDLPYSEFGQDNKSCFNITKLYNEEEQAAYVESWSKNCNTDKSCEPFLLALNEWLEETNPEGKDNAP